MKSSSVSVLPEFPKYANQIMYSDINPWEVVKVISEKTLEIRPMRTEPHPKNKETLEFHVGGFAGHCSNQWAQEWIITSSPNAETIRIRLTKSGWWKHGSLKFELSDEPRKFYDYNF